MWVLKSSPKRAVLRDAWEVMSHCQGSVVRSCMENLREGNKLKHGSNCPAFGIRKQSIQ